MKKSVYGCKIQGTNVNYNIDLEILLDINRELTDNDNNNIRECVDKLIKELREETASNDPDIKADADKQKAEILALFGDRKIYVQETSNEYCDCYICKHMPWFLVITHKGTIKIGWRKRVINIDWTNSGIKEDAETLFPDEDVTKYNKTIHAWGYEKAKEYLDKLLA